jgi:hypothetical protein
LSHNRKARSFPKMMIIWPRSSSYWVTFPHQLSKGGDIAASSLTIRGHCAISNTSSHGLSIASCVRSIFSRRPRQMPFLRFWSRCLPSICVNVPVPVNWSTIRGWMWIGTRKQRRSRALCGERFDASQGHDSAGTFSDLVHGVDSPGF